MRLLTKEELLYGLYHLPVAISAPFISWYFYILSGGDYLGAGMILAIVNFFLIFSSSFFGWLSDIFGSKNLVSISLLVLSLSYIVYYLIESNPWQFFITYICFTFITSAFIPSFNRLISFQDQSTRSKSFGRLGMWASIGFLTGSVLSALLLGILGFRSMLLIAAFISIVPFLFSFALSDSYLRKSKIGRPSLHFLSPKNLKSVFRSPILILLIVVTIINASNSLYMNFFAIFVEFELFLPINSVAIMNAIATILGVFATYFIGWLNDILTSRKGLVAIAALLYSLLPFFSFFLMKYPIIILLSYCIPVYSILFVTVPIIISEKTIGGIRGRSMGNYNSAQYLGLAIGAVMGSFLATVNNKIHPNFLVAALIGFIGFFIVLFKFKDKKIMYSSDESNSRI